MGSRIGAIIAGMKQKGGHKGQPKLTLTSGKTITIPNVKGTSEVKPPTVSLKTKSVKPKW